LGLTVDQIDAAYDAAVVSVQRMADDLSRATTSNVVEPPVAGETPSSLTSSLPDGRYQDAVRVAKEHILAGDIFQVVLSQRFETQLDADPFDFYRVLRQVNPSPYMYYVKHEALTIAGSSPEPLVQVRDGKVVSRPIAGTRKRGRDDEHDRKLAGELRENPKERAEHVMLVDLARNDVGRVAKFGTVKVDELMTLERYSHVMHLTSQVSGELRDGLGPIDVLRATLPAGTVSGAPKVRAMEIIDALEPVRRGPYAGIVGYVDFNGNLDAAIAIRTMFAKGNTAWFQAGAGIVADSDPDDEHLECHNKAAALIAALPTARRMTAQRKRSR
jgi:anthranilate synthase component I